MGHIRLGMLPRSRRWQEVVGLVAYGAEPEQVASVTMTAAARALASANDDVGLVESVWVLTQLPLAAREDDFVAALKRRGLHVSEDATLTEITGAVTEHIDRRLGHGGCRTDLGELAQMAVTETISEVVGKRTDSLFGAKLDDIKREMGKLATKAEFSKFAKQFYARLTTRLLNSLVDRTLADHVGPGKRFATVHQQREFSAALEKHCDEASVIVERFSGAWLAKTKWERGEIDREAIRGFAGYALQKMTDELREGASEPKSEKATQFED